jgi:hypothetical protein
MGDNSSVGTFFFLDVISFVSQLVVVTVGYGHGSPRAPSTIGYTYRHSGPEIEDNDDDDDDGDKMIMIDGMIFQLNNSRHRPPRVFILFRFVTSAKHLMSYLYKERDIVIRDHMVHARKGRIVNLSIYEKENNIESFASFRPGTMWAIDIPRARLKRRGWMPRSIAN